MTRAKKTPSDRFEEQLVSVDSFGWIREHRFHPDRKWAFDFAWVGGKVAVEVEGIVWKPGQKSRHQTPGGFTGDRVKYNVATLMGWLVLNVTPVHVDSGAALSWAELALKLRGYSRPFGRSEDARTRGFDPQDPEAMGRAAEAISRGLPVALGGSLTSRGNQNRRRSKGHGGSGRIRRT